MAYLALVRHGLSEWNKIGLWTGLTDISLAPEGREQARQAGEALKEIHFDIAFVSKLIRAKETLDEMLNVFGYKPKIISDRAIEERDYGIYTGKNKWEVKKKIGDKKYQEIRRGWNIEIPEGESLKQVYDRVIPYFEQNILTELESGKNVLVSAHGNSLRALVKYLDKLSNEDVTKLNIATGETYLYEFDSKGLIIGKKIIKSKGGPASVDSSQGGQDV